MSSDWRSVPTFHEWLANQIEAEWTAETQAYEALLYERNEGGGLYGVDPVMHQVRRGLITSGNASIEATRRELEHQYRRYMKERRKRGT